MKLTREVEYKVLVKAILDDENNLKVSLSASAPYGKRTATATLDTFDEKLVEPIREALQKLVDAYAQQVAGLAENAAAQARSVAIHLGEEI